MSYTLGQAAKATGKSKPTISRAIENGTISAIKNPNGSYTIDPAELHRVFSPLPLASNDTPAALPSETPNSDNVLQLEVKMLRERLEDKDRALEDVRLDRDKWRDHAERISRQLAPPAAPETRKKGWWPFGGSND